MQTFFRSLLHSLMTLDILFVILLFHIKRTKIIDLQRQLQDLENHFHSPDLMRTELKIRRSVKIVAIYLIIASTLYSVIPMLNSTDCKEDEYLPCGLPIPVWYPFSIDQWPTLQIVQFILLIESAISDYMALSVRLFQYAITKHTIRHMKNLERNLKMCIETKGVDIALGKCVEYHVGIIK